MLKFFAKNGSTSGAVVFRADGIVPGKTKHDYCVYLSEVCIDNDGSTEDTVLVQVDTNALSMFAIKGEYKFTGYCGAPVMPAMIPDRDAILRWWKSLGCPLDARQEETDLSISYEEVGKVLKSLQKGKLEDFSNLYSYNKGVNSGTWGTYTSMKFIEGNDDEGIVELHTTGTHPRVNCPHVKVDFKRLSKVSNGYLIPTKKFFEYFLEKWNDAGRLKVSPRCNYSSPDIYVKGRFCSFRPEISKMLDEKVDFSTPAKIKEILQQVYGAGEETLFVENLISFWVGALSS